MWEETELKKAVDFFVRGEYYCSRQPASQVYDYDSIKHLAFGTHVDGRTDEFIVYNSNFSHVMDTVNKLDVKKDYWLTVFSDQNEKMMARIKTTIMAMDRTAIRMPIRTSQKTFAQSVH